MWLAPLVLTLVATGVQMRGDHPALARRIARWLFAVAAVLFLVAAEVTVCNLFFNGCSGGLRVPLAVGLAGAFLAAIFGAWPKIAPQIIRYGRFLEGEGYETGGSRARGDRTDPGDPGEFQRRLDDVVGALGLEVLELGRTPKMERSRIRHAARLMDRFLPPEWGDEDPRTDAVDWLMSALKRERPELEPPMRALACSLGVEREYSSDGDFPERPCPTAGLDLGEFGRLFRLLRDRLDRLEFAAAATKARKLRGEAKSRNSAFGTLSFGQAADAIRGERGDGAHILAKLPEDDLDRLADKMERSFARRQE